jgi:hypothetical protein
VPADIRSVCGVDLIVDYCFDEIGGRELRMRLGTCLSEVGKKCNKAALNIRDWAMGTWSPLEPFWSATNCFSAKLDFPARRPNGSELKPTAQLAVQIQGDCAFLNRSLA